ncbi:hypothetical protein D3P07_17875 [Paenibacillus sp. 1011MAR3C5]|nr:hypothetical protein D3P07_17875 [Paenibacillus sp. 1011MAR3C5]
MECDTCQYHNPIFVGLGFSYLSLQSIASFVHDPDLKRHNVPIQLSCPACNEGLLKATFYMDWD